jgi:hypothetical protein
VQKAQKSENNIFFFFMATFEHPINCSETAKFDFKSQILEIF